MKSLLIALARLAAREVDRRKRTALENAGLLTAAGVGAGLTLLYLSAALAAALAPQIGLTAALLTVAAAAALLTCAILAARALLIHRAETRRKAEAARRQAALQALSDHIMRAEPGTVLPVLIAAAWAGHHALSENR